jgi:hypothetical protein
MFTGLVVDEEGSAAEVTHVGESACYVVYDDDFKRHIDAEQVDRQVLRFMREQVEGQREAAVSAVLDMMGKDDLFTKAAVEASINNMEESVGQPIPEDARQLLGMMGFHITINIHGDVVDVNFPAGEIED